MRVQAFITSGILEKHVLGMTTPEESQEVLELASQHLEIKEELAAIRKTVKSYIHSHQVALPANLKEKAVAVSNKQTPSKSRSQSTTTKRASSYPAPTKVKEKSNFNMYGIATLLLGIALIGACFTAYTFFNDAEKATNETAIALEEVEQLKKHVESEQKKATDLKNQLGFYHDRNNEVYLLKGTSRSPGSKAIIYWNATDNTASIDLPAMPNLREGTVPILWVNANRRSNKIGVLAPNAAGQRSSLNFIENPDLFYVTEEASADAERPNRARILMVGGN